MLQNVGHGHIEKTRHIKTERHIYLKSLVATSQLHMRVHHNSVCVFEELAMLTSNKLHFSKAHSYAEKACINAKCQICPSRTCRIMFMKTLTLKKCSECTLKAFEKRVFIFSTTVKLLAQGSLRHWLLL